MSRGKKASKERPMVMQMKLNNAQRIKEMEKKVKIPGYELKQKAQNARGKANEKSSI